MAITRCLSLSLLDVGLAAGGLPPSPLRLGVAISTLCQCQSSLTKSNNKIKTKITSKDTPILITNGCESAGV